MSKEADRNQINHIIERERKKIERPMTDEMLIYKRAEEVAKSVVQTGRSIVSQHKEGKVLYDRGAMESLLQGIFKQRFVNEFTHEEVAYLLGHILTKETISAVEL